VGKPELLLLNEPLCDALNVSSKNPTDFVSLFFEEISGEPLNSFAQAYAGHQFGHFTLLGDGRAIVLGEHVTAHNHRFDIQLKGCGRTPYSRGGDGRATLKAMLREYLLSEAMHHLNIPTSRSLAVAKTGETVFRERNNDGAVMARVMKSHIRVGTFEYASYFGTTDDLKALLHYTIQRLYPQIEHDENQAISLLRHVMTQQINLVVQWMRVGFIHGVMNTDNVSISGETFDYGPCAFMNTYHPETVYSSIDTNGRYAFGKQPGILKWNIARFAEALLPIIDPNEEKAIELAQSVIQDFDAVWNEKYYATMLNKIGIESNNPELYGLVHELLDLMKKGNLDYTNTFLTLSDNSIFENSPLNSPEMKLWLEKWKSIIESSTDIQRSKIVMRASNPVYIPRNHLVEQALEQAVQGNMSLFEELSAILEKPYDYQINSNKFLHQPDSGFETGYRTFCGT
jgi:uncharacterized protein YdiU (UPF0061 family)